MGATTIDTGGETTVQLDMIMHPGMEGPHLFRVTVPVQGLGGSTSDLLLYVAANFE